MQDTDTIAIVRTLFEWSKVRPEIFVIQVERDRPISIAAAPCKCNTVIIPIDWPLCENFIAMLDQRVDAELDRAMETCICHKIAFRPDFALMGVDQPGLTIELKVECMNCDARGPGNPFEARRAGWTRVDSTEELADPEAWFTHMGLCPKCSLDHENHVEAA